MHPKTILIFSIEKCKIINITAPFNNIIAFFTAVNHNHYDNHRTLKKKEANKMD